MRKLVDKILVVLYLAIALVPVTAMILEVKDHRLEGAYPPRPRPTLALGAVLDDSYQTQFTQWFETSFGLRAWAVWIDNSILYHVFSETRFGSRVVLGPDEFKFERDDIDYFNGTGPRLLTPTDVDAFATRIADVQTRLRARGRALVPVLIPSKTTFYRDKVPAAWTRDLGEPRPSSVHVYRALRAALDARGITYVDGIEQLTTSKEPRDLLWGRDARHFSNYAGCLVVRATMAAYATITSKPALDYPCIANLTRAPRTHADLDLFRLANVWGASRDPVGRDVRHDPVPASPLAAAPTTLFIASSFGWVTKGDAALSKRFTELHLAYYNSSVYDGADVKVLASVDPSTPAWQALFLTRDLYVLELHETYVTLGPGDAAYFGSAALDALDAQLPR